MIVVNAFVAVDTFFLLSGLLFTYTSFKKVETSGLKISEVNYFCWFPSFKVDWRKNQRKAKENTCDIFRGGFRFSRNSYIGV